jgi:hypothetical protein
MTGQQADCRPLRAPLHLRLHGQHLALHPAVAATDDLRSSSVFLLKNTLKNKK